MSIESEPILAFEDVSQAFLARDGSEVRALDGINLSVTAGEFVAIVGPSGCGKSTALRLVAGLDPITRGQVRIAGGTPREGRDRVGMVFQKATLLHWLTVEKNVLLPVRVRKGRPEAADIAAAHALLDMVGLGQFAGKHPQELSGGMQQRAAICRALIQDPDMLLMDEPFGALDALTREDMCIELLRIWDAKRKTILFVTHSIPEAVLLADRVVVMTPRPGRIADIVPINLPRPRSVASLHDRAFQSAADRIRKGIYGHDGTSDRPTL
jgi:NitT/TauT family transport system ATP-binding protein